MSQFKPVNQSVSFPLLEEEVIQYWKKNNIFEKSVEKDAPKGNWTFLDGPPFITGNPHYGSLLVSMPKDVFPRFKTMQGYRVRRVWGWDCHGLPAENKVETKLGLKSKKEIEEKVGVKKFIDECKSYVSEVSSEWEWYIDHIGRWVDFKNAYKTMDRDYMETVMWVFKQMYDKGFIYKGLRVSLYCPHCATPISNFEVAMDADNYKEVPDAATTYKYEIKNQPKTYILAWSTTPWNKIVTSALAVNPKLDYVKVLQDGEYYILAKSTLKVLDREILNQVQNDKKDYEIVEEISGKDLIGLEFEPHYNYYAGSVLPDEKAFVVIGGDFVTADEGTGVVTIAAYGEEDLKVMKAENVHIEMHLDEEGTVKPEVPQFGGMYYLKANKAVNEDLASRGLIYKDEVVAHNVPLCWRCHTRLYYAPQDAWYVDVQSLKPLLRKTNDEVNWFPAHFKYGRFLKSLENAPDWNISRSRYWGSPVPVWECECGERFVPGSIAELEKASDKKIEDLHKPEIDEVTIVCKKCGKDVHRVPEVLDSWIEAGSASFAERHFPFGSAQGKPFDSSNLEEFFPPDFIVEYTGQIRAWFYVLHVIGGALHESPAFKNVSVTGVILGTDGRKMSKNFGNYPDPKELIQKYGGDALRLYLLGSPVMNGEDIIISEEQYRQQVKGMMLILWNVYNFFVTYANLDGWKPPVILEGAKRPIESGERDAIAEFRVSLSNPLQHDKLQNMLDLWIISRLHETLSHVTVALEGYDTPGSIDHIQKFIDDFSTWYIRRSRDRVGASAKNETDKIAFYKTTYYVLTMITRIMAPIAPFITEEIYRNLTGEESVHLTDWPEFNADMIDVQLQAEMTDAIKLASILNDMRKQKGIRVKIPFKILSYSGPREFSAGVLQIIQEEANIYELKYDKKEENFSVAGSTDEENQDLVAGQVRDIVRKIQAERKNLGTTFDELVDVVLEEWPEEFKSEIQKKALVRNLSKGEFSVSRV